MRLVNYWDDLCSQIISTTKSILMNKELPKTRLLFLCSMIIALGMSLMAFEYRSEYILEDYSWRSEMEEDKYEVDTIIRIALKKPELPDPKPKSISKRMDPNPSRVFKAVSNDFEIDDINPNLLFGEEEENPFDVDPDYIPPALPVVQSMPYLCECEGISDKELRAECSDEALQRFIGMNTKYPSRLKSLGVNGKIFIQFVIEKDGSVNQIEKLNSVHPLIDGEALRVVAQLPCFKPGSQGEQAVRVLYRIPFNFELR